MEHERSNGGNGYHRAERRVAMVEEPRADRFPPEDADGTLRVSVHQLRQRWGRVLRAMADGGRAVIITRRGREVGVFLPYDVYADLAPAFLRRRRRALREGAEAPVK